MFFPWPGFIDLVRSADIFVHLDNVPLSKGSFTNRVQLRTPRGKTWMTVPLRASKLGTRIDQVLIDNSADWKGRHLAQLRESLRGAPHGNDAEDLVSDLYTRDWITISGLARESTFAVLDFLGLRESTEFVDGKDLNVNATGSDRVLEIVRELKGDVYVTAHGGRNYLDHFEFESNGIEVKYIDYQISPYGRITDRFDPFVSCLDLIAWRGASGASHLKSTFLDWREFIND